MLGPHPAAGCDLPALTFETQEQLMCPERAAFRLFLQVGCLKRGAVVQWVRKLHHSLVYLVVVYLKLGSGGLYH